MKSTCRHEALRARAKGGKSRNGDDRWMFVAWWPGSNPKQKRSSKNGDREKGACRGKQGQLKNPARKEETARVLKKRVRTGWSLILSLD